MTVQYEYECAECGERELVSRSYLDKYGVPMCDCANVGDLPMRRKYSVSVVWPKEQRGHG